MLRRATKMRPEEYSPNWRICTSKELFRPVQSRFCMGHWVNRMRLSPGWKRPTRSATLNSRTSKWDEDSSPCAKIRDLKNSYTVSGYPIKAKKGLQSEVEVAHALAEHVFNPALVTG